MAFEAISMPRFLVRQKGSCIELAFRMLTG